MPKRTTELKGALETKQLKVEESVHHKLKLMAAEDRSTMTKIVETLVLAEWARRKTVSPKSIGGSKGEKIA